MDKIHFQANQNTGRNYKRFNRLTAILRGEYPTVRRSGSEFGEIVKRHDPTLHKQVFGEGRVDRRTLCLQNIFNHMFPAPKCVNCGGPLKGKCHFYCTKPCSMQHRNGYTNPSYDPEVKARRVATCIKNHGVAHPLHSPEIVRKLSETLRSRSAVQKQLHKARIIETNLKRYGVRWNSQHPEILSKIHRSSFSVKEFEYQGKRFEYQGWEDKVIICLVDRFGKGAVLTQYSERFPREVTLEAGTRPDLYVTSKQTFVEVKSEYTFFTSLKGNRRKAQRLEESGNHCRWIVVIRNRSRTIFRLRTLPPEWYRLSKTQLKAIIC